MSNNVKNRQTRVQDSSMETLEAIIEDQNLLDHKVILLLLEPGDVDKNVAGLIANKLANKYQRPCCILTKTVEIDPNKMTMEQDEDKIIVSSKARYLYQGSARGYELTGVTNFKDICDECGAEWTAGHQNAFGLCIAEDKVDEFLSKADNCLSSISAEPIYYVDYIYNGVNVNPQDIFTIAELTNLWGKDMDEAEIAIKDLKVSKDMVQIYRKTNNTLKISLPNKISIMKFNATDEECERLENQSGAYIQLDVVGTCKINEFNGCRLPQVFITDYEITGEGKYLF
jgi:single-stranded DNA-specific DHH superfamily exonuclease